MIGNIGSSKETKRVTFKEQLLEPRVLRQWSIQQQQQVNHTPRVVTAVIDKPTHSSQIHMHNMATCSSTPTHIPTNRH